MFSLLKIFFILILILTSCTSTHLVKCDEATLQRLNREFKQGTVTITLKNDNTFETNDLRITPDTTYYTRPNSTRKRFVFTSDIQKILYFNQQKGTKWGGVITGILGGMGGLILGLNIFYDPSTIGSSEIAWVPLTLTGAAVGIVIGQKIGSYIGVEEQYIFNQEIQAIMD